ncbi:MAG TPA: bifunctional DNA primase/polymerase [Anaerolineales bacterium]
MSGETKKTTDHDEIRKWVEERGGYPATVVDTGSGGEPGVLRIDFPGYSGQDSLQRISWEDFFQKFDEENLAFLYQDRVRDGEESRFFKFVSRER